MIRLTVTFPAIQEAKALMPLGLSTPHSAPHAFDIKGARMSTVTCPTTGQVIAVATPEADLIEIGHTFGLGGGPYPDLIFKSRDSRYTRAATDLSHDATRIAREAGGGRAGMQAILNHTATQFDYGHPDERFYEPHDHVPQLCGLTEGSCVDINIYLLAALRSAGYEAGYITGYFVPDEKRTWCNDSHCWVVTRLDGVIEEWDIAHCLKLGRRDVTPGLNPKPGVRVAMAHSMGWTLPELGLVDQKLMGPPGWLLPDGRLVEAEDQQIRLEGYEVLAAA
ncbi:MAG: transglutaminase-like domain-containing protein [Pseudomonadota bacterium]